MLQAILRVADRLLMRKRKFDPISDDIRDKLHWLPVEQRIWFKIGVLVHSYLHGNASSYLSEMLTAAADVTGCQSLRSAARGDLVIPCTIELLDMAQGCSTFSQNTMFMYDSDVKFILILFLSKQRILLLECLFRANRIFSRANILCNDINEIRIQCYSLLLTM